VVSEAAPAPVVQGVVGRVAAVPAAEVLEEAAAVAAAEGAAAVAADLEAVAEEVAAAGQMAAGGFSVSK
jgi:hypothetical protein